MHDVIIGSAKQECVSKRAKYVVHIILTTFLFVVMLFRQLSIQRAKRGKFRISPEIKVSCYTVRPYTESGYKAQICENGRLCSRAVNCS